MVTGRVHVVGGMTARRGRLASMEAYDPREGRWSLLPPMSAARSSCGCAPFEGRLYVVAGAAADEVQHRALSPATIPKPCISTKPYDLHQRRAGRRTKCSPKP